VSSIGSINEVSKNISLKADSLYRYKDNTLSLFANYSEILLVPSNSSFTNAKLERQYKSYYRLGYLTEGVSSYTTGGTIFSDLILANKYIISYQELPNNLYKLVKQENDIYYYESKYNLSFAIPYFGNTYNDYGSSIFNYQNNIYKKLFEEHDNIIEVSKPKLNYNNIEVTEDNYYYPTKAGASIKFAVDVKDLSNVYMNLDIKYGNIYKILVNGEPIKNPTLTNRQNKSFPISDQTTILLGQFENQTVNVELKTEGIIINDYEIGTINIDKFIGLVEDNKEDISITTEMSTMKISYDNTSNNKSLLLPLNYSDGFNITNNGEKISYTSNFNNYISIDLEDGNNYIVIKHKPKYFDLGLYITILSILVFNLFAYMNKKINFFKMKNMVTIFLILFYIIEIILFFKVYILSLF